MKIMRSPNTQSSQVQQKHTAPYFVSHLDSMSSNELTSHSHYFQSVSRFGTYADRLVASAVQFPMDLCSASAIQPISFYADFVVSQNSFNSIKLQISSPRFPLLLFTLSNTPTQNYTTVLFISQDTLQSSNAANLVELHASLLVVQDVQSTWPKVRKGNPPGSTNITSILFSDYISTKGSAISNVGKSHWQSSL